MSASTLERNTLLAISVFCLKCRGICNSGLLPWTAGYRTRIPFETQIRAHSWKHLQFDWNIGVCWRRPEERLMTVTWYTLVVVRKFAWHTLPVWSPYRRSNYSYIVFFRFCSKFFAIAEMRRVHYDCLLYENECFFSRCDQLVRKKSRWGAAREEMTRSQAIQQPIDGAARLPTTYIKGDR